MSTVERKKVVADHMAKVKEGNAIHVQIASHIKSAKDNLRKRERREKHRLNQNAHGQSKKNLRKEDKQSSGKGGVSLDNTLLKISKKKTFTKADNYFFDYNTVESVLLSCAILVCLAGTMLEAGKTKFTYEDGTDKPEAWQRDIIGFLITFVVITSVFYYTTVFANELGIAVPNWVIKLFANKKKATDRLAAGMTLSDSAGDDSFGGIELAVNPLHSNKKSQDELSKLKLQAKKQDEAQRVLMDRLKIAKKQNQGSQLTKGIGFGETLRRKNGGLGRKKKKKAFDQKVMRSSGSSNDSDQVSFSSNPLHRKK
eukprot:g11930.t1